MESLSRGAYEIAFIVNPQYTAIELLRDIIYNLGYREKLSDNKDEVVHKLLEALVNNYENGKRSIILIDEAHLIKDVQLFEELRMLLNFQHNHQFLLTLLLFGQPDLRERISNIKQFAQRVSLRFHLGALDREDVPKYIKHRLEVAGTNREIFENKSFDYIFNQSGGIPRRINQICDKALFTGYCEGLELVDPHTIETVVKDLESW